MAQNRLFFEITGGSIGTNTVTLNISSTSTQAVFTSATTTNAPTGATVIDTSFYLETADFSTQYTPLGTLTVTGRTASSITFSGALQADSNGTAITNAQFPSMLPTGGTDYQSIVGFSLDLPAGMGGGEPAALANQNVTGPSTTTNYTDTLTSIDENTNSTDIAASSFMNNGIRNANIMVTGTWEGTTTSSSTASETTNILAENIASTITESTGSVSVPSTNPQTVKTKNLQGTFTAEEGNWNKSTSVLAGDGTQYTTYRTRLVEKL